MSKLKDAGMTFRPTVRYNLVIYNLGNKFNAVEKDKPTKGNMVYPLRGVALFQHGRPKALQPPRMRVCPTLS